LPESASRRPGVGELRSTSNFRLPTFNIQGERCAYGDGGCGVRVFAERRAIAARVDLRPHLRRAHFSNEMTSMSGLRTTVFCISALLIGAGVYGWIASQPTGMSIGPSRYSRDTFIVAFDASTARFVAPTSILMGIGVGYLAWGRDERDLESFNRDGHLDSPLKRLAA
jgi:hypothetical protein